MSSDVLGLLDASAPAVERIPVDYGPFFMQSISGEMHWQLMRIQQDLLDRGEKAIPPQIIVAVALCKEDGSPVSDDISEVVRRIARMKRERMYELYDHAIRITGLGVKAVEDGEKKSSSSQNSGTGTNSLS